MRAQRNPQLRRIAVTLAIVALASVLQWALKSFLDQAIYIAFYPTIIFAAIYGNGILAIVLSVLSAQFLSHSEPGFNFVWLDLIPHSLFVVFGLMTQGLVRSRELLTVKLARERDDAKALESRKRAILASLIEGVVFMDNTGKVRIANDRASEILGYRIPLGTEGGKPGSSLVRTDGSALLDSDRPMERALKGESVHEMELGILQPGGSIRWVLVSARPVRDEQGEVLGAVASFFDISDRRAQELATRNAREVATRMAEERQLALDGAKMGWWHYDPATQVARYDRRYREIFGVEGSQRPNEEILKRLHPDDLPRVWAAVERALDPVHPEPYFSEYRIRLDDGSERWVEAHGTAVFAGEGKERRAVDLVGTVADITERKHAVDALRESETRFKQLADFMPQIVWTATAAGEIDYLNGRWYEFTGLQRARNWKLEDQIHPEDLSERSKAWQKALTGKEAFQFESRLKDRTEEYRWFLEKAVPISDDSGVVTKWFGTFTDIEDQKRIQTLLQGALTTRDTFLSIASHELKTPLTSLKLQTALTLRQSAKQGEAVAFTPEKVRTFVLQVDQQVNRLVRLVEDMLDLTRIATGKLTMNPEHCDLSEVTREVVERLREALLQSSSEISLEVAPDLSGEWDRMRVEQVITNLLTNAARYGDGKPIEVRTWNGGSWVHVSVRDHGKGIAPEDQVRIFERFERASSARHVSGLGLGLYISRQIVQAHGGRLDVESELGQGATFTLSLPRT